ncbi:MAG: tetratricopeptide repeat protein [Deltaproteobacteria bacterium]|nr:tetratricopeptide repeat protein [Deltaproteobacteria bacterium]
MTSRNSTPAALLDRAEELRRAGKTREGLELVERSLGQRPDHPRALFLRTRLLFEQGSFAAALETLRPLSSLPLWAREVRGLQKGLERIVELKEAEIDPAFATESMAQLRVQQGYLLEAMEIYRRLWLGSPGEARFWEEISRIRDRVEREGSRDKSRESLDRELSAWDRWMQKRKRGS